MTWTNYHTHSLYCDGSHSPSEVARAAFDAGLTALGFSSHCPLPFHSEWSMNYQDSQAYIREIKQLKQEYQGKMEIYLGMEVDFIPEVIGPDHPGIFQFGLDYTIGSIHFVDQFPDGTPWEIDGDHHVFLKGLNEIFKGNIKKAIRRYYELTRWMIQLEQPDILGHLDKIKIQSQDEELFSESEVWYREEVYKTLKTLSRTNVILEINTRGLYSGKTLEPYPSRWILEQVREMEIPITINSDAHHPDELTAGFNSAARMVLDAGIDKVMIFSDGYWQKAGLTREGLILPNTDEDEDQLIKQA